MVRVFKERQFLSKVIRAYYVKVRMTSRDKEEIMGLLSQWHMQGWNGALREIAEIYRECGDVEMAEFYEEMWRKYIGKEEG